MCTISLLRFFQLSSDRIGRPLFLSFVGLPGRTIVTHLPLFNRIATVDFGMFNSLDIPLVGHFYDIRQLHLSRCQPALISGHLSNVVPCTSLHDI
ncbi:hypothetical protein TNCV_3657071 [Trichonephila clavipes]|nr:hypothetical protein TNCV_3657071 [Trichonephila clavipes]